MADRPYRIAVVAPAGRFTPEAAEHVRAIAGARPGQTVDLTFHPQCFLSDGHFAGSDKARLEAVVEVGNDPSFDAVWFARGGYGSNRIAEAAVGRLGPAALDKAWLGYSDLGFLMAGLFRAGARRVAHGPMCNDLVRDGGETAVQRALEWLVDGAATSVEPAAQKQPCLAFNLTVLSSLLGTPLEPDFTGRVLMLEEVAEHHYRIDRSLFHVTSTPSARKAAGLMLGRCSDIPPNDPAFGQDEEAIARHWCEVSGIRWLGRADIGHDADNKVVPFG